MKEKQQVRICVPVCERSVGAAEQAIARAAAGADMIEVRLDCLEPLQVEGNSDQIAHLLADPPRPMILTYRPAEQGGRREFDTKSRMLFWLFNRPPTAEFLDIELDVVANAALFDHGGPLDWDRVICSHHDFTGVPKNLDEIYGRMARSPARILKIAVRAADASDCLSVFGLLERAQTEKREMIAIAMGRAGIATRILGPSRGAFLTYGSLANTSATAPGQISAEELRTLYRIDEINRHTQITGLAGFPVSHSISPHVHNANFAASAFDGVYIPFEVRDIASFMKRMVHPRTREIDWHMCGLSVTAPHKRTVMDFLDWIEPAAKEIGAVNTIVVDGVELRGYNTDAGAFIKTLTAKIGGLRDARCAVIGAGGAANAALWGLRQKQAQVTVYARNEAKAKLLAERFGAAWATLGSAPIEGFDVVINATPLGTSGGQETETPATAQQLGGARLAYDLVYNPPETAFLRAAREAGCEVLGGLEMLVTQAAEQFRLWTGGEASEEVMTVAAIQALSDLRSEV